MPQGEKASAQDATAKAPGERRFEKAQRVSGRTPNFGARQSADAMGAQPKIPKREGAATPRSRSIEGSAGGPQAWPQQQTRRRRWAGEGGSDVRRAGPTV